ncbi:MAG: thioredoxin-disulfide reductase [Candidatus Omnitrophica bacterium]|nr:thioredoxin-disulfide reductase [Candidatus Omnitrophota bacterium]
MYDLIIIGAGPAGLTAGLYAGRFKLKTLILEKMVVGGQIILSPWIDNFPGFPEGIATQELVDKFKKQVDEFMIKIEMAQVIKIEPNPAGSFYNFRVDSKENAYDARSVIVATGAQPKSLGVPGEDRFIARGISYCATCDGPLYKNKEIAVIGAGDRAIEEAILLANYAKKVTVIHRRNQLRASPVLEDKAKANPKISFFLEKTVEEVIGDTKVRALRLKSVIDGTISEFACEGVFVFVGVQPDTGFLSGSIDLDEKGFILADQDMQTSRKGVFACGDCRKKSFYQVVTACSDGAIAAASAQKFLI